MKYTIEILERSIDSLEVAYMMRVVRGTVDKDSEQAIINRHRVDELKKAINILQSNS